MQIEYKIRVEKDGLTITEWIDSGVTASVKPDAPVVQNSLGANAAEGPTAAQKAATPLQAGASTDPLGGAQGNRPRGGNPETGGSGAITIFGPFVFLCPADKAEGTNGK